MTIKSETKPANIMDAFITGARNGWSIGINSTLPNVLMAFVLIRILDLTGLLELIGIIFAPIMGIFGLPGVAATVLMAAIMSMGGGVGVAVALITDGAISEGSQVATLLPAIYLMGSLIQYVGRISGTAEVPPKYNVHYIIISIMCAFMCMFVMNIIT